MYSTLSCAIADTNTQEATQAKSHANKLEKNTPGKPSARSRPTTQVHESKRINYYMIYHAWHQSYHPKQRNAGKAPTFESGVGRPPNGHLRWQGFHETPSNVLDIEFGLDNEVEEANEKVANQNVVSSKSDPLVNASIFNCILINKCRSEYTRGDCL
jgi:hypothetical protein